MYADVRAALIASCALLAASSPATASCNVVPRTELLYPSTLGTTSHRFVSPQQVVEVRREAPVFVGAPDRNTLMLEFLPVGGPPTTILADVNFGPCTVGDDCGFLTPPECDCIAFPFPDTDAYVGAPDDGRGLTGPVRIRVFSDGVETAVIDHLFLPDYAPRVRDPFISELIALPPQTDLSQVEAGLSSELLAARDSAGNVYVPLDYTAYVEDPVFPWYPPSPPFDPPFPIVQLPQTRFFEALVPGLGLIGPLTIDALTARGARLPPLIRTLTAADTLLGTIDAPESVLRVADLANLVPLPQLEGTGPIVIGGVSASADATKRGDPSSMVVGERWAIFENRECGPYTVPAQCVDVNADGDLSDYLLQALDLETPGAEPITIDELDGQAFAGYPEMFGLNLYSLESSDKLVAFRVPEPLAFFSLGALGSASLQVDLDGDGVTGEIIRSGAFDLTRGSRVTLADDSPRLGAAGGVLAFSVADPGTGVDILHLYDADQGVPGPYTINIGSSAGPVPLPITRNSFGTELFGSHYRPPFDVDLTVAPDRIGFSLDEAAFGEERNGEPGIGGGARGVIDYAFPNVDISFVTPNDPLVSPGMVSTARWLAFGAADPSGLFAGAYQWNPPAASAPTLCRSAQDSAGFVLAASDSVIVCEVAESGPFGIRAEDLNGDGDSNDVVLHVYLPDAPGGPVELNLGLAHDRERFAPLVHGNLVVFAVDELRQQADLNENGIAADLVLHVFNATLQRTINTRTAVLQLSHPSAQFVAGGLSFQTGDIPFEELVGPDGLLGRRAFLRDLDGDEVFEDVVRHVATGAVGVDDNCPTVANPLQEDEDGDGIGDACDACVSDPLNACCPPVPVSGCTAPAEGGRGRLLIKKHPSRADRDKVLWKWLKGPPMGKTELGDPLDAMVYTLCVYDQAAAGAQSALALEMIVPPAGSCAGQPCWKETGKGYRYKDRAAANDGTLKLLLKADPERPDGSKIILKGKGDALRLEPNPLPLTQDQRVTAQLIAANGKCWESIYSSHIRNDAALFKASDDAAAP